MKDSKHLFQMRPLIPPRADSLCTNRVTVRDKSVLQYPSTSSVLRRVLGIGLLGQTQDILGHNWFYYFSVLANLSSSGVHTFQKEHCQIGSFFEENCRNYSIWKIFHIVRN